MIKAKDLIFSYDCEGGRHRSLDGACITVRDGELVAVLGHNGCGKSTLVKHFNALLEVQKGELTVAGLDAKSEANIWTLRRKVGMVFQNPDNQFVSSVVAEDVAFGLENNGVPAPEIHMRISELALPPSTGLSCIRTTRAPVLAAEIAENMPPMPPPTTQMSAS